MATMRRLPLLCLAAALSLSAGCATRPSHHPEPRPARPAKTATPRYNITEHLLVISAVYGSGDKFADVTYRVNDLLRDPETVFWAKPQWLGADPTPGWNKALVIVYEHDGRRRIFSTGEGGEVSVWRLVGHARSEAKKSAPEPKPNKQKKPARKKISPEGGDI